MTTTAPTRTIDIPTPITEDISDDDIPLVEIRKHKTKSIESLSIPSTVDSMIPLGTDLRSLPGITQEDLRDTRFLNYNDVDNLANHLNACLAIDKNFYASAKPYIFKTRHNVLNKILKIYYLKTFRRNLVMERRPISNRKDNYKQQPLSVISSPTTSAFKTDWNVNRRNASSKHQHTPKNFFHILQQNPKRNISAPTNSSLTSTSNPPVQTFERIKDILARTYYPHLYTAIEYGYEFGTRSIIQSTQQLVPAHNDFIPIKQPPESPCAAEDSTAITLISPPGAGRSHSSIFQQSPVTIKKLEENEIEMKPFISIEPSLIEDLDETSPSVLKKSIVLLTPAKLPISSPPLIGGENKLTNNRKRRFSPAVNTTPVERKKKRIISSPPPEIINQYEDISNSERY